MKLSLASLALLQLASAQTSPIPIDSTYLQPVTLLSNSATPSGTGKCALINVVMDESGSMTTEQNFMKDDAIPGMLQKLYGAGFDYDDVLVCSNGFGSYVAGSSNDYYRHLGCSLGNADGTLVDPSIVSWVSSGHWEEGYHALSYSISNVPQTIGGVDLLNDCGTLSKNIILVSDEDRDASFPATVDQMKTFIDESGYILNLVVDATIENNNNNVGFKSTSGGSENTIFQASSTSGQYTTYPISEAFTTFVTHDASHSPYTSEHYIPLIVDEPGAVWNVKSLRDGVYGNTALRASFTNAFIDVKVEEIDCPGGSYVDGVCSCPGGSFIDGVCTCPSPLLNLDGVCSCPLGTSLINGSCQSRTESSPIATPPTPSPPSPNAGGDPHITTWKNEHYEYHGQCDLVMMKDPEFMNGLGLHVHIRTKVVRYWSYIQSVAIKIGNDILEIEGSSDANDAEAHYWVNFESQGELDTFAGFPVTQQLPSVYKRTYTIDLSSKHPGASIVVQLYKEFVRVKFEGATKELFGKTVGLLGDYETGKTLARDGSTTMHDFTEFGDEWQVLPSEPRLFHELAHPQFPELCVKPEDPRGDRKRRLAESSLTIEQAEAACQKVLSDELSIKDCVYDILATQDLDMVGAF